MRIVTELSSKGSLGAIGDTVPLKATLTSKGAGRPLPDKILRFRVAGKDVGTAKTGSTGEARLDYKVPGSPPPGSVPMDISFAGDPGAFPSATTANFAVLKSSTKISLEPNPHINEGETAEFRGTLVRITDQKGLDRQVALTVNGHPAGKLTATGGRFALKYKVPPNFPPKATVSARFEGDALYNPAEASAAYDVRNPAKTVRLVWSNAQGKFGETIPLKAYVAGSLGGGIGGLRVKIRVTAAPAPDPFSCHATTNSLGIATCLFKPARPGVFGIMAEAEVDPDVWKVEANVYPRRLDVSPAPVKLELSGPSSARLHTTIRLKARLTRATDGHPVEGKKISLSGLLSPVSQTTNASGETAFEVKISNREGPRTFKATFRETGGYYESGGGSITINVVWAPPS